MRGPVGPVSSTGQFVCKWGWPRCQGGPAERASLWSCATRRWLNLPHTKGDWLYRVGQGSVQGQVPTTQMLSWVASSPIRIPSRETTPALPDSESYPGIEASLLLGRFSMPRTHICAPGHMVLQPRRILDQCFWTAVCSSIHSLPLPWGLT